MCEQRIQLLNAYDNAVEQYASRTSDLKIVVSSGCTQTQYDSLLAHAKGGLVILRAAKLALWEHRQLHKC